MWIGALVAVIALRHWSLYYPHDVYMRENKASSLLAHGTMLQDLLGVPNTVNVMWTLSYEMVFYLLVTGLFVIGLHKFSAEIALLFAATALFAGGALPKIGISNGPLGTLTVVLACTAVFCLGLAAVMGIVRTHNGGLRVFSTPGKGSTFRIYLPVLQTQTTPPFGDAAKPAV